MDREDFILAVENRINVLGISYRAASRQIGMSHTGLMSLLSGRTEGGIETWLNVFAGLDMELTLTRKLPNGTLKERLEAIDALKIDAVQKFLEANQFNYSALARELGITRQSATERYSKYFHLEISVLRVK